MEHAIDLALLTLIGIGVLVIVSLGLAIVFGLMGVINLAHGELLMLGAVGTVLLSQAGIPLAAAMVLSALGVAVVGAIVEVLVIRRLYGRREYTLLATFGLGLIIVQVVALTYGTAPRTVSAQLGTVHLGGATASTYQLLLVGVAAAMLAGVYLVMTRTHYGLMARAATQNAGMAASVGVNAARVNMITFAFGAGVAGLGGALLTPLVAVVPTLGADYVARAFMTVIVGGPAVVTGTAAAAGALGVVQSLVGDWTTPVLGAGALLVCAIVILRVMPTGISGRLRRAL